MFPRIGARGEPDALCAAAVPSAASVSRPSKPLLALDARAGEAARELLNAPATADLAPFARDRFITGAKEELASLLDGPIADFVRSRAQQLMVDHAKLRAASGTASRVTVEAVLPPDVIGLFPLLSGEG